MSPVRLLSTADLPAALATAPRGPGAPRRPSPRALRTRARALERVARGLLVIAGALVLPRFESIR
ncbi:hypothetical protein WMF31_12945 [Sorangium sp. So ce1036]|uniref:hypothetical protein n=1 Tax=Sorangium sp. So ce1036 TaxID=3133328 RepID=UPI003F0DFC10